VPPGAQPKKIGRYRVEAELGRGMMGIVYRAVEPRTRRRVALKVIRVTFVVSDEQRRNFERRFLEEARIVSRLSHPGIVKLHELGEDKALDAAFIALEYLEGRTLSQILAEGPPLSWRESLEIVAKVAAALHYAHGQGVIHRDIKPGNIMVLPSGQPKLMDFGVAKLTETGLELTSTGQFMGTPLYMSPEQALGEPVDNRADLFSLGSIAYTMLTGRRAFEADSVPQVLNKVAYQHPPAPSTLQARLPPDVDYLLARAMAKPKTARYADGKSLAEDIEDVLSGRPPRHKAGWKKPDVGEGTLVSQRPRGPARALPGPELAAAELEPVGEAEGVHAAAPRRLAPPPPAPAARARRGHRPVALLALSMLALGVVMYSSAFWRARIADLIAEGAAKEPLPPSAPAPLPTPSSVAPTSEALPPLSARNEQPSPDSDAAAPPVGEPGALPGAPASAFPDATPGAVAPDVVPEGDDPAPDAALDAPTDGVPVVPASATPALPSPAPQPTPMASAPPPPAGTPASPSTSRLSIFLEHRLKQGQVRVWIDDKLVLAQSLTSRVTHDLLLFKLRSGAVEKVLPVRPGRRRVRVAVRAGSKAGSAEIAGTHKTGTTHRLRASVEDGGEGVKLAWE
jgi:serine/threonine-protein kinase